MNIEKKLNKLINSGFENNKRITNEKEKLLIDVLAMVQTLNKDHKLKELALIIQKSFPEYGKFYE